MKLREFKRIIFLLKRLESFLEHGIQAKLSVELIKHYTDSELREMIHWLNKETWSKNALGFIKRSELIELIRTNYDILLWTVFQLEASMTDIPSYSQDNVCAFFERTQNEIHYLASKPVGQWDAYDKSNYHSLLLKTGTTKKVFAIFTADVKEEDKYAVTTQPSFFFDTKEEAEIEMERCYEQGFNKWDSLKIMSLWKIN